MDSSQVGTDQVTAVVRTTSERTLSLCCALLADQVPDKNTVVIQEAPACNMVRRTHEIGLERNLPWTLAVDADVLLREHAVRTLVQAGEQTDDNVFLVYCRLVDKFVSGPRIVGVQLFRTSLCETALKHLPDDTVLRPDSHVKEAMRLAGYPYRVQDDVLGLHDYEQYFRDIFRKGFLHAKKHKLMIPVFESLWSRLAAQDPDYQVALWGLKTGQVYDGPMHIDIRRYPQHLDTLLTMQSLAEKDPLPDSAMTGADVSRIVETVSPPEEYYDFIHIESASSYMDHLRIRVVREGWRRSGWARFLPWLLGAGLKRTGTLLMNWSVGRVAAGNDSTR